MEQQQEHLSPLAVTHLLQHTLRSLCIHENSQWIYAVFWRILPRNYPPPKWEGHAAYDRSRGNRRNWILVWEDGFCNFGATSASHDQIDGAGTAGGECSGGPSGYGNGYDQFQQYQGLQPELFFKMSHEIYNYGEGLLGKVAADHSHKWIHKEPKDQEINFLSAWHNSAESHPRTWEAQFQSGIKTIALIAVREGVVQLGSTTKVIEDLSYVVLLRKKFSYIESIPGVLLPHPSSPPFPFKVDPHHPYPYGPTPDHHHSWHFQGGTPPLAPPTTTHDFIYDQHQYFHPNQVMPLKNITPSMSSLEALLSKLPSVVPSPPTNHQPPPLLHEHDQSGGQFVLSHGQPMEFMNGQKMVAKEEASDHEEEYRPSSGQDNGGETSTSMSSYYH